MAVNLKLPREQIEIKLQNITPKLRSLSSQNIAIKIIHSEIFIHSQNIACYIPIETEIDTWSIIKNIWEQEKNCYLPAFSPHTKNHLCFVRFMTNDRLLKIKKYKTLEPEVTPEKIIAPEDLDLVIVPLMGFTSTCFRLGRGAGCYDRTFAFKKHTKSPIKPYLLGVGYKFQQIEFEPNPWDIAMDEIVAM